MRFSLTSICTLLLALVLRPADAISADSLSVADRFVQHVQETKRSIAYIEVGTDLDTISSVGTAFLVNEIGLLATCRHILFDTLQFGGLRGIPDTSKIFVRFHSSEKWFKGRLVADRADKDIALIRIGLSDSLLKVQGLRPVKLGQVTGLEDGTEIGCIGYDLTQRTTRFGRQFFWLTTHKGIVSNVFWVGPSRDSTFIDAFQIDATVNKGASGAPVFLGGSGDVVGMVNRLHGVVIGQIVINYGIADCVSSNYIAGVIADWAQGELQRRKR